MKTNKELNLYATCIKDQRRVELNIGDEFVVTIIEDEDLDSHYFDDTLIEEDSFKLMSIKDLSKEIKRFEEGKIITEKMLDNLTKEEINYLKKNEL